MWEDVSGEEMTARKGHHVSLSRGRWLKNKKVVSFFQEKIGRHHQFAAPGVTNPNDATEPTVDKILSK